MMVYLLMVVFLLSWVLTWGIRQYALTRNIMDIPNQRSSHEIPTPRGGGVAFIIAFLVAIPCLGYLGFEVLPIGVALIGAGLLVAALGFLDDHKHIAAYWRLLGHFGASIFALYWLGGMPSIVFLGWLVPAGVLLNIVAVIYLVWLINLYNFMDGIDGLAAIEAICVCLGGVFIFWLNGNYAQMGLPLMLAVAVTGFWGWNFPPARIFMGDVGSSFLGLMFGILTIQAAAVKPHLFWCWLILLGVFIVDATVTLLYRVAQGYKAHEAHRSHAYQHAVRRSGSHFWVAFGVLLLNVFWLLPIAVMVDRISMSGCTGLIIAYLPLVILAMVLRAGRVN